MTAFHKTFVLREPKHASALWEFLKGWKAASDAGMPWVVQIGPEKAKRSHEANKYYFGAVINQISDKAWVEGKQYSSEVWHEIAKRRFIGLVDLPGGGTMAMSSANLSTSEFDEFVKLVEAWAATDLGVVFMEPDR